MRLLFVFLSRWPLLALHGLGWVLGWLVFVASPSYRRRLVHNAKQGGLGWGPILAAVAQTGKMMAEIPRIWLGRPVHFEWDGADHVTHAYELGKGVIFLTPHLGCFEMTGQAWAQKFANQYGDLIAMYRPARKAWMASLVASSRNRPGLATVPASPGGVRHLIKSLRASGAVVVLPDQVPPNGQGLWVPFFGQPAYTMTLAARLAHQTGATVLVGWGERLPWARGYRMHVEPLLVVGETLSQDLALACGQINLAMERLIQRQPDQYLWGYGRYKQPREARA